MIENKFGNFGSVEISKPKVETPVCGAYMAVIKNCYPVTMKDGNLGIEVDVDITEGPYKDYGVRKAEATGSQYWALGRFLPVPKDASDTAAAAKIKRLWTAVADSNTGFEFNENASAYDEHQLIGKKVGIMVGGMEKIFEKTVDAGKPTEHTELVKYTKPTINWFMATSRVATSTNIPEIKPLNDADQARWNAYQLSKNGVPASGFSNPVSVTADADMPF